MALDFSILSQRQPTFADAYMTGQQEAQRNALTQQQLLHAQQQNALAGAQMQEYQRKAQQANRLPQLLGGMPATATVPEQVDVLTRAGYLDEARKLAESHAKAEADRRAAESSDIKNQFDRLRLTGQLLSGAKDEPSYRMVRSQVQQISPQFAAALPDAYDPDRLNAIISQGIDLEKRIADETARRGQDITAGTAIRGQDITSETARRGQDITAQTAKAGQAVTMRGQDVAAATTRRGQDITAETAKAGQAVTMRGQDVQRELAFKPVFNAQAGGYVVPPSAAAPQGAFIPLPQIGQTKEQDAAVKALKSAGYDATTGKDRIEELINKSTSGRAGAGIDAVVSFFGGTTKGREAIGALASRANQIALDMAGGKLGAGISNADRDFIVSTLGDVANPVKPARERLAAWREARARMLVSGMLPPPKPSGANQSVAGQGSAPAPAANIDALLNKYK